MVYVFFDVDDVDDEVFREFLRDVPAFRREKVVRYRFRTDRINALCAYVLLCGGLGRRVEAFSYGAHDKPFLPGGPCFSITHCDGCVAAGVAPSAIGVDAERVVSRPKEVAAQFFTPAELRLIDSAEDADAAFFTLWTLKESYCKILGTGLSFNPLEVEFSFDRRGVACSDRRFIFAAYEFHGWRLAVGGASRQEVVVVDLPTLRQMWEHAVENGSIPEARS